MQATDYNVLAPGPVNLHPSVREALALPMIHHRTPEFDQILSRTLKALKEVFHTKEHVYILTATGSGGMEALLINTMNAGDKVLGIDSGKFGERWCEIAKTFGGNLHILKTEWGKAIHTSDVAHFLKENPDTQIVFTQACETSTGVLHPIRELGELIQQYPETLFLVDGITALGAIPLPMDEWHIDGLVGGSQKAFMLPAGLSFLSLSQKAQKKMKTVQTPRFYFDLRKELKANQNGETFFSSNVTLIRALDVVLSMILQKGLHHHFLTIANRANFTRKFTAELGLENYSESPSNSVSALRVPPNMDGQKIRSHLEEKYKITIMGGQDQAKGKIIRIGHMGDIHWDQMQNLMICLAHTLKELNPHHSTAKTLAQLELEMKAWIQHV